MGSFCEDVRALIGEQLRDIGAARIRDMQSGSGFDDKEVCFFSASGKVIAIMYSPRDGESCFIGEGGEAELTQYESWDSLWHVLGMDKDLDFDNPDSVAAYFNAFPKGHREFIEFIGDCLVEYFGSMR